MIIYNVLCVLPGFAVVLIQLFVSFNCLGVLRVLHQ